MEADLALPGEEDADGSLAGVRRRVTGRVIVDLRTSGNKEENGGDESCFDDHSCAALASDTSPFAHRGKRGLGGVSAVEPPMDVSQQSSSSKDRQLRDQGQILQTLLLMLGFFLTGIETQDEPPLPKRASLLYPHHGHAFTFDERRSFAPIWIPLPFQRDKVSVCGTGFAGIPGNCSI